MRQIASNITARVCPFSAMAVGQCKASWREKVTSHRRCSSSSSNPWCGACLGVAAVEPSEKGQVFSTSYPATRPPSKWESPRFVSCQIVCPESVSNPLLLQEEIIINAQTLTKGLQALKSEHEGLIKGVDSQQSEKIGLLEKSLEMIDLGLGEAHVMVALASHLQVCDFFTPHCPLSQESSVCAFVLI